MKPLLLPLAAAMLAFALPSHAAEDHHHHHHGSDAPQTLQLNAGKKWPTDDALRQGMGAIRALAETALPTAHAGKLAPAGYDALARETNRHIAHIIENCKLDPKADAQLHLILADLNAGVDIVEGKQPGQARAAGVVKISRSLNAYGKHFNHAGWRMIKLPD